MMTNHATAAPVKNGYCKTNLWTILLILFLAPFSAFAQQRSEQPKEYSGAAAQQLVPGAELVKEGFNTPYPSFVRFGESSKLSLQNFLPWLKQNLKTETSVDFRLIKEDKDELGFTHYRYAETYLEVPIDKAAYVVHVKGNQIKSFNGLALHPPQKLSATPQLTEALALQAAMHFIGAAKYKWEDDFWESDIKRRTGNPQASYLPKGQLCWHVSDDNKTYRLAYKFDINSASPDKVQRVYVDAITGAILKTLPLESNCSAATVNSIFNGTQNINTDKFTANDFRLRDDCQSAEIRIRNWNSATSTANPVEIQNTSNTWTTMNERFGASVLWTAKNSYLYWLNVRGRASYDNANGDMEGYINAIFDCTPPPTPCYYSDNASMSFSGGTLKVGLGSSGTLANSWSTQDIIGHEYAHAVTGSSAGLDYQNESGALNESFSDIFGEATENFALGSNDWLMGNERTSGAIRSLASPNLYSNPDTYLGTFWYTGSGDNGGVHTNSGVQNHWFYLLVAGGSGTNDNSDAYSVSGIGLGAASAIASRNLINYLTSTSNYSDARTNAIQAAIDLYGACSNEVKQTTNAWYAVGVGAQFFDATVSVSSNYNGRDVSCFNACNGAATVNVISGSSPAYSWSTGATTQSISGLCPGTYSVTVTNGDGCTVTKSVTINNTPLLTVSITPSDNNGYGVSCNGSTDGTATANPSGGTSPYSYSWSNGQTTKTATGLAAGFYTVTVTDVNGCTANGSVTITQPPLLTTTAAPTSDYKGYNVQCHGGNNGSAEAYPVGGVPPYTYLWSNGQTSKEATMLFAITYTVTVTDANGCTASAQTTLTEPPALPVATITVEDFGGLCNHIDLTAHSSTTEGTYAWSNGETTQTISLDLTDPDGVYSVFVTDQQGCTSEDSAFYIYLKENLLNSYTILAKNLVSLGELNNVESGAVGVKNNNGSAWFDKNCSVAAPGAFVKADNIHVTSPSNIPNRIYNEATVPYPPMQYVTSTPPLLSAVVVLAGKNVTINGNYATVTIGVGANVTLTGNAFGLITIASDATVTFTQTAVNIGSITTLTGLLDYTTIRFTEDCNVKVSGTVSLGTRNKVNPDGKKVMFFMSNSGLLFLLPEFFVGGSGTTVNANILMPDGRIKVAGGISTCYMTGVFMAREVVSIGKKVTWNNNDCEGNTAARGIASSEEEGSLNPADAFNVIASPNPAQNYFVIRTESADQNLVNIRVVDVSGKVVEELHDIAPNTNTTVGPHLAVGSYFAEVVQGSNRRVLKLVKVN